MTEERSCKHAGCLEPAMDKRGMYAGLCEFHKNQKRHLRQNTRAEADEEPSATGHAPTNGGRVDAAERFLAAARALAEAEAEYDAALASVQRS